MDTDGALADYDKAISLAPYLSEAFYNRGTLKHKELGDSVGALADYDKAISHSLPVWLLLIWCGACSNATNSTTCLGHQSTLLARARSRSPDCGRFLVKSREAIMPCCCCRTIKREIDGRFDCRILKGSDLSPVCGETIDVLVIKCNDRMHLSQLPKQVFATYQIGSPHLFEYAVPSCTWNYPKSVQLIIVSVVIAVNSMTECDFVRDRVLTKSLVKYRILLD